MHSVVAQRIWDKLTWLHMQLTPGNTAPYASYEGDLLSLNKMWKKLSRKCWSKALSSHARAVGKALLFWLPRKMVPLGSAWTIVRTPIHYCG